jgi:FdhD protein
MASTTRRIEITRVRSATERGDADRVATEAPLEVRVGGEPFAVIMRTPGADEELTAGFLFSEGLVRDAADVVAIQRCRHGRGVARDDVVKVDLGTSAPGRTQGRSRRVVTNSSCGMCGRVTIESLKVRAARIEASWEVERSIVSRLPEMLRASQTAFDETGGLHAAGLFAPDGALVTSAEDVGRHNAVDKVIGRRFLARELPLDGSILFVSGRTSFEIVQKAFLAGIPIVAAVSAPSSLAIDLADEAGMTLVGFVRGDSFNVYSHPQRIAGLRAAGPRSSPTEAESSAPEPSVGLTRSTPHVPSGIRR